MNSGSEPNGRQRRRFPRYAEQDSVMMEVEASPDMPELERAAIAAATEDISAEGMRLGLRIPLPVGTCVRLQVALPTPRKGFSLEGRLVWIQEQGNGHAYHVGLDLSRTPDEELTEWRDAILKRGASARDADDASPPG